MKLINNQIHLLLPVEEETIEITFASLLHLFTAEGEREERSESEMYSSR